MREILYGSRLGIEVIAADPSEAQGTYYVLCSAKLLVWWGRQRAEPPDEDRKEQEGGQVRVYTRARC